MYSSNRYNLSDGQDVIGVLPTVYGKSVIVQLLPFLMTKNTGMDCLRIVIIIFPLNSIMQDQVMSLKKLVVNACFLDIEGVGATACQININRSDDRESDEEDVKQDVIFPNVPIAKVKEGNYCFLYAHRETLIVNKEIGKMLRSRVMQKQVCSVAADEVNNDLRMVVNFQGQQIVLSKMKDGPVDSKYLVV